MPSPLSTVGTVLRRPGLGRLKRLEPPVPVVRYPRERPGELVHIDTKKLGKIAGIGHRIAGRHSGMINRDRGIGWIYLARRGRRRAPGLHRNPPGRAQAPRQRLPRAGARLVRAPRRHGRIMTDNGSPCRSHDFRDACANAGVRHVRTRPYTPRTNGTAGRFLQRVMPEFAYARALRSSQERADALPRWLHIHNVPHAALAGHHRSAGSP